MIKIMKTNKKRIALITMIVISLTCMYSVFTNTVNRVDGSLFLSDVEALTAGESGGDILYCYCALMSDSNCAVNNNGASKCASGVNVRCWEFNNNCN